MAITCPNFAGLLCTGDVTADAFCGTGTYFDGAVCTAGTNESITGDPLPICQQDLWMGFFPTGCSLNAQAVTVDAVRGLCGYGTAVDPSTMKCTPDLTPDSTPATSTPATSTPDSTTPDSTTPDSTTPDSTTPDATTPDSTTPDATTPDSTTPDATTPDSTTPDSTTPDATTPDSTTPDATTPDSDAASPQVCSDDQDLLQIGDEEICVPKCYDFGRKDDGTCNMQGDECGTPEQGVKKKLDATGTCAASEECVDGTRVYSKSNKTCVAVGEQCGVAVNGVKKEFGTDGECKETAQCVGQNTIFDENEQKCACDPEVYASDPIKLFKIDENNDCKPYGECKAGHERATDSNECSEVEWHKEDGNCLGWRYKPPQEHGDLSAAKDACLRDENCKGVFFNESKYELRKNLCDQVPRESWMNGRCVPGRDNWASGNPNEPFRGDGNTRMANSVNVFCDAHNIQKTWFKPGAVS